MSSEGQILHTEKIGNATATYYWSDFYGIETRFITNLYGSNEPLQYGLGVISVPGAEGLYVNCPSVDWHFDSNATIGSYEMEPC